MPGKSSRPWFVPALLFCFFISGAAGLMEQVVWSKTLGLIFGHTAYAVATVLAVFIAGLAAGSAWIGKRSERWSRPIAFYGWLEFGVALTAAISLAGLAAVRSAYVAAYPYVAGNAGSLLVLRFAGSALVLFPPTFLMGGTLPVLVRGITSNAAELGARLSRLYWINTAGAVTGTFAAGFLFLPSLGLRRTLAIAVSLNLAAAVLAFALARTVEPAPSPAGAVSLPQQLGALPSLAPSNFFLNCFAIVGATVMSYEIAWTRLLSIQLGSSTHAFTLMLGTFLTGIMLVSALYERWSRHRVPGEMTFAFNQTLTALAALAFLVFFTRLIEVLPPILRATLRWAPPPPPRSIRRTRKEQSASCAPSMTAQSPRALQRSAGAPPSLNPIFQSAFRAFDAALAIDPTSLEAAWGLAESNRRFGNNEKARQELQQILERDLKNPRALSSLTKLGVDFSRWPEAEILQRQLIAAGSNASAVERAQLTEILMHENKTDQAYRAMQDSLALDPYNYQAHLDLGKLLATQNKWTEARKHLEFVMRYFPDQDSEIYLVLFQADKALGDPTAAAKAVRFGLRVFPDNSELRRLNMLL